MQPFVALRHGRVNLEVPESTLLAKSPKLCGDELFGKSRSFAQLRLIKWPSLSELYSLFIAKLKVLHQLVEEPLSCSRNIIAYFR